MLDWLIMLKDYKNFVRKPSFVLQKIFNKDLAAIHEINSVSTLDKPIYVGFSVIKLSKFNIYDFHYNYILKNTIIMISCYLQSEIVWLMKLKQMMFMKIFIKIEIYLIMVIIQKIQRFLILLII